MAHDHAHGSIANTGAEHQKRLMMSLGLTSTVFIAEVISAVITESLALLVDAGHMLTDMSVLIASTVTAILMQRKPSNNSGSRSPHPPHRRYLCACGSRHETFRRICRRSKRRAIAALHGHTRPRGQYRINLYPRIAKRRQHEHESGIP